MKIHQVVILRVCVLYVYSIPIKVYLQRFLRLKKKTQLQKMTGSDIGILVAGCQGTSNAKCKE